MSSAAASSAMAAVAASPSATPASFARSSQGLGQGPPGSSNAASTLDPLSQQILLRTSTGDQSHSHSISLTHPHRLGRNPTRTDGSTNSAGNSTGAQTATYGHSRRISQINGTSIVSTGVSEAKEKRRGSSFFNRLSILGGRKKDGPSSATGDTDTSDLGDLRSDSASRILMSPAASGYIPHHKEPVKYQRVKCNHKHTKDFGNLFLAQELTLARDSVLPAAAQNAAPADAPRSSRPELTSHDGAVWCMEFSQDGRYLAAAGQDGVVRVYAVLSQPEDRFNEEDNTPDPSHGTRLRAPVFTSKPVREFAGHEGEVLDLTWSKNGFLLSSSMDKSVRLWHLDYQENLCIFKHSDFVTSISFHPRDDRFFLAGSLDSTLRLWSIPDKTIAFSAKVPDLITAVAFTPDGRSCIAGMLNGLCMFFETEGLKLEKEMHVRSSRGKNSKGSKITGIETLVNPGYGDDHGDGSVKVLITSNDSRIRLYNLRDKGLELKLKGHENLSSQIHSRLSDDGRYVVCGSEDKKVFIWPTTCSEPDQRDKDKRPVEYFEAHDDIVTVAMFAPASTRRLLGASDDPVYDLCNPPPVTLMSRDEESVSQVSTAPSTQRHHTKPGESPAYIARAGHKDGNILVTSDKTGVIRVWRQDCAFVKRRHENLSSNRLSTLTRTGSIMTRNSFASSAPYSRRASMSQLHGTGGGIDAVAVVAAAAEKSEHMHSEMINSWRHNIEGGSETRSSSVAPPASETSARDTGIESGRGRAHSTSRPHTPPYSEHAKEISASHSPVSSVTSRDLQVPPTPSFSYDSIEESPEESDEGKAEGKSAAETAQEGLLGSFFRHWRGKPLALQPSLAPIPAEKTPTPTAGPGPVPVPLNPPVVGVQKPSFEEENHMDEELLATTPTPSNIHLLSPKSRAQRRHSAGPRTMLGGGYGRVREVPAVALEDRPRSAGAGAGAGAEGAMGKAGEGGKKKEDEGPSCAGCGRDEFTSRKLGGRVRQFCAGCGTIAPVS